MYSGLARPNVPWASGGLLIGQNAFLAQLGDHQREFHIDARDHLLQVVHAALQQFNLTCLRFRCGDASFK